ncbi:MAG: hypothetical protein Q7P63_12315 [Verrucomicrobiota bacterium JB022]|nr:hypothetical protein [Verrucomicrobiota bacterium JB022]
MEDDTQIKFPKLPPPDKVLGAVGKIVTALVFVMIQGARAPFESFLRTGFGERYFSTLTVISTFLLYTALIYFWAENHAGPSELLGVFTFQAILLLFVARLLQIRWGSYLRDRQDIYVHSRFPGKHLPFFEPLTRLQKRLRYRSDFIKTIGEPLLLLFLSLLVTDAAPALSLALWFAFLATLLFHGFQAALERRKWLDRKDRILDAEEEMLEFGGSSTSDLGRYTGRVSLPVSAAPAPWGLNSLPPPPLP